jgi:PIN domain nuclease of toxin-antitoxin system
MIPMVIKRSAPFATAIAAAAASTIAADGLGLGDFAAYVFALAIAVPISVAVFAWMELPVDFRRHLIRRLRRRTRRGRCQ